jgi:hypothetical protein
MKKKFVLFYFALFFFILQTSAQNSFYDSIVKKAIPFTFGNPNNSFASLPNFPDKDFYLFGEWHGTNANLLLALDMITSLHKNRQVKNIIIEMPHSEVFFFQKYIETGDTSVLKRYDGRMNIAFLDKIIQYNKNLETPIRLFGIDMDIQYWPTNYADCISYIVKENNIIDSVSLFGTTVNKITENRENIDELRLLNKVLKNEIISNETKYASLFTKDFLHLKTILLSNNKDKGRRDDEMEENFEMLYKTWFIKQKEKAKFLAFFGDSHTSNNSKSFYTILNNKNSSPVVNNVSLSGIQYVNCNSSEHKRQPKELFQLFNAGFVIGPTSLGYYKNKKKSSYNEAFDSICELNKNTNVLIPLFPNNHLSSFKNDNRPFKDIDMLFIIQNETSTQPLIK